MNGDANPVHVRLLESLPRERIRTHVRPVPEEVLQRGGRPAGPPVDADLVRRFRELDANGRSFEQIRRELGVGTKKMRLIMEALFTPSERARRKRRRAAAWMEQQRKNPVFAAKQRAAASALMRQRHADPEWRARNLQRLRDGQRKKREAVK